MKKLSVLLAVLLAALFVVGCASKPPAGPAAADLLAEAKVGAPSGTLVGQATASSQRTAENNAAAMIKRALKYIVGELVDAQVQSGRVSTSISTQLKQTTNTALDSAGLNGIHKVDSGADTAGRGWAVYALNKDEALKEINIAVTAAKEDVAAGNFNPSEGFDAIFLKAAGMEWK